MKINVLENSVVQIKCDKKQNLYNRFLPVCLTREDCAENPSGFFRVDLQTFSTNKIVYCLMNDEAYVYSMDLCYENSEIEVIIDGKNCVNDESCSNLVEISKSGRKIQINAQKEVLLKCTHDFFVYTHTFTSSCCFCLYITISLYMRAKRIDI